MKIKLCVVVVGLLVSSLLAAQSTPPDSLIALSKRNHTLAIVDPASLKVIARVPVGNDPHEVVTSTDGKTAYVSNYGFGQFNTLAAIDLVGQKPLNTVDLGPLRGPHGLTFVGGKTWFTAEAAKAIGRYDPQAQKVDWILGTGQNRTHMLYVSADEQWIVTTNVNSATVSIIEKTKGSGGSPPMPPGAGGPPPGMPPGPPMGGPPMGAPGGDWNETVVPVGRGDEGFDVSPDSKEIWVANAQDGTVSIIDRAEKKVVETLPANVMSANRLKFTLDGKLVLISSLRGPELDVIDAATRKEVKRVKLGRGAAGILMEPGGRPAFVACSPDNSVAVVDLKTLEVVGRIDVGPEPDGLAWASQR